MDRPKNNLDSTQAEEVVRSNATLSPDLGKGRSSGGGHADDLYPRLSYGSSDGGYRVRVLVDDAFYYGADGVISDAAWRRLQNLGDRIKS